LILPVQVSNKDAVAKAPPLFVKQSEYYQTGVCLEGEVFFEKLTHSIIKRVTFIGNYLPRQCGIATFTTYLSGSIAGEYKGIAFNALTPLLPWLQPVFGQCLSG